MFDDQNDNKDENAENIQDPAVNNPSTSDDQTSWDGDDSSTDVQNSELASSENDETPAESERPELSDQAETSEESPALPDDAPAEEGAEGDIVTNETTEPQDNAAGESAGEQSGSNMIDDLREKTSSLLEKADEITDKIPGEADDKLVDQAQNALNNFGGGDQESSQSNEAENSENSDSTEESDTQY